MKMYFIIKTGLNIKQNQIVIQQKLKLFINRMLKLPKKDEQSQVQQGQEVSQHSQSSQWIKVRSSGRKNLCEMCSNILAKYTCPKCDLKTCSLDCTRKHKDVKSCSGQRQPVQYVNKNQIDEKVVQKDYNFIEDMISSADKVKKVLSGVNTTISMQPRRFKILRNNARQLYNIRLSNGPNILQRHRDNISFFFVKTKSIYWVFELLYFHTKDLQKMKSSRVVTQPISDEKTFLEILPEDYLDKQLLESRSINTTKRQEFLVFLQNKQKQNEYSHENSNAEKSLRPNAVFTNKIVSGKFVTLYELIEYDINTKINEQMKDIAVFEFPTLFVVHKSLRQEFLQCYKESKTQKSQQTIKPIRNQERGSERQRSREKSYQKKNNLSTNE